MSKYLKFVLYVVTAVVGSAGVSLLAPGGHTAAALFNVLVLALTAAGVYFRANTPTQPWAKMVIAVLGAAVTVLTSAWSDHHIDTTEIVQIVLAILGAIQVGTVANVLPGTQSAVVVNEPVQSAF